MHQCSERGGKQYVQVNDFPPIFFRGKGDSAVPLNVQACILYAIVASDFRYRHKSIERIFYNLEDVTARYVHVKRNTSYIGPIRVTRR